MFISGCLVLLINQLLTCLFLFVYFCLSVYFCLFIFCSFPTLYLFISVCLVMFTKPPFISINCLILFTYHF